MTSCVLRILRFSGVFRTLHAARRSPAEHAPAAGLPSTSPAGGRARGSAGASGAAGRAPVVGEGKERSETEEFMPGPAGPVDNWQVDNWHKA